MGAFSEAAGTDVLSGEGKLAVEGEGRQFCLPKMCLSISKNSRFTQTNRFAKKENLENAHR